MFTNGDNTVRVAGFRPGQQGIYDTYQFSLINLSGKTHDFAYAVPAGLVPATIVRDLLQLFKQKLWFVVYLKEARGVQSIFTIKEPKQPQNELWDLAQKLTPQTAKHYKELTGESVLIH